MLKAAEICERWLYNSTCCLDYWGQAWKLDPPRADAPFYIGQHYRLRRDGLNAVKILRETAKMTMPRRNNFQWPYLYECLRHIELVRAGSHMTQVLLYMCPYICVLKCALKCALKCVLIWVLTCILTRVLKY